MSINRKLHQYTPPTGKEDIDELRTPLTAFIQSYQTSLDIGSAKTEIHHTTLIVTLLLFTGDEYLHSNILLNLNPIYIFIREIEKTQKSLASKNNKVGLNFHIEPAYTAFTFSITSQNASALKKAIENQLTHDHPIPDKKYFLAKLKYQTAQNKWKDKAIAPGDDNKTPKTIQVIQQILQNDALDDHQQFAQVAEIIAEANNTTSPLTSIFRTFFRDAEVEIFYASLQKDIVAIQIAELEQTSENAVEMDPVYDRASPYFG